MIERARRPVPWVTYLLIAANLAVFAWELASGADPVSPSPHKIVQLGGDFAPLTLGGQWWRIGASMFLHYGVIHVGMNMIVLWQARFVELLYGRVAFAVLYLASGLVGAVASLAMHPLAVGVGASGAVFGVFGAFGAFLWMNRDRIAPEVMRGPARGLASFILINLIFGLSVKGIDITAHIGGLVAGFVAGALLLAGDRERPRRGRRALVIAIVTAAAAVAAVRLLPQPSGLRAELARADAFAKVLDEFQQVEKQCVDEYNAKLASLQAGGSAAGGDGAPALADVLEHDILPRWRAMRAHVDALASVPPALAHLHELLRAYVRDRDDEWTAYAALLRGGTLAQGEHYKQLAAQTKRDGDALGAELAREK